jgi:hypothetical protein
MIAFNRVASIAPGKTGVTITFAHEIAAYMKDAYGVKLEVLVPIGGNPQRIAWTTRYKDLAAMDNVNTRILADTKYWELVNKASANFLPGSVNDSIWRVI